jgi:hypothetical protein
VGVIKRAYDAVVGDARENTLYRDANVHIAMLGTLSKARMQSTPLLVNVPIPDDDQKNNNALQKYAKPLGCCC